jgi:thiosulfate/3-mercaptopyruvate sulfurtransferase
MAFQTLIDTATLADRLEDSSVAIVDCRFKLDDPAWGEREYGVRHIRGAVYADLDRDLSGAKTGTNGRHPLPDAAAFARTLSRLGIDSGMQVVAYDQDAGMFASRLWWMLRWLGHDAVAVLDGGFAKWLAENRPTSSGRESRPPRTFTGSPRTAMTADANAVAALAGRPGWRLVDARAPERFRGENETIDKKAGHIPGATNHFFKGNLSEANTFLLPEALRERFRSTLDDTIADRVVCYCGSGVTACHNLLALEHAGLKGAKLYPGSWSEWSSDPARPTESGDRSKE